MTNYKHGKKSQSTEIAAVSSYCFFNFGCRLWLKRGFDRSADKIGQAFSTDYWDAITYQ